MEENNTEFNVFRRSNSRLSMLDKSLERRRVNKEHNSNFRAGYVAVHEDHLHKTGLRGRKRYLAYLLLLIIYLVAIANLVLTVLIIVALKIDQNGSGMVEYLAGGGLKYKTKVWSETVLSDAGEFGGYKGQDLEINGDGQPVIIKHMKTSGASVELDGPNMTLRSQEGLHIINPTTGNTILHTTNGNSMPTPTGMRTLTTTQLVTAKLAPGTGADLTMESDQEVTIQGNEGLSLGAKVIELSGSNVIVNAFHSLSLEASSEDDGDGGGGLYFNTSQLPRTSTGRLRRPEAGHALCVCVNTGRLIKVTAPAGLANPCGSLELDPCS